MDEVQENPFPFHPDFDKIAYLSHLNFINVRGDLSQVPPLYRTKTLIKYALMHSGENIRFVPKSQQLPEFCEIVTQNHTSAIIHIHPDNRTEKMLIKLIKHSPSDFQYLLESEKTLKICKLALNLRSNYKYVPFEIKTFSFRAFVIRKHCNLMELEFMNYGIKINFGEWLIILNARLNYSYPHGWRYAKDSIKISIDRFQISKKLILETGVILKILLPNLKFLKFFPQQFFTTEIVRTILHSHPDKIDSIKIGKITSSAIF